MNPAQAQLLNDNSPIDEVSVRAYRQSRIRSLLSEHDIPAAVFFDPVNIRYVTGTRNMQVWTMHNFCRYVYIAASGPCILFEVPSAAHLADGFETVDEVRPAWSADYMVVSDRMEEIARIFADEVADLVRNHGAENHRLAIDRLDPALAQALDRTGLEVVDSKGIAERARSIKSNEEIRAFVHSLRSCEQAVETLRAQLVPGMTEVDALSILIGESIKRGGEYPETRLMTSGPRTNPWFQETSLRPMEAGEFIAFDTDLIGPMGFYNDISRTWVVGDAKPSDDQRRLYATSRAQLETNIDLLHVGDHFLDFSSRAYQLPEHYLDNRYADVGHGCGLGVEYPFLWYPEDEKYGAYDGVFEENMVVCIESYVGAKGGAQGVKLEQPVWLTNGGPVLLSEYPLEDDYA